jgi:hypothetical protein
MPKRYALFVNREIPPYLTFCSDGTGSGMVVTSNSIITANASDFDGGTNAVKFEGDQLGAGPEETVNWRITDNSTFKVARNLVKFKIKVLNQDMVNMWFRVNPSNVTSADICHINVTDGTVANDTWEATPTLTDIGSGWWQFEGVLDFQGDADVVGTFGFAMGNADNDVTVFNETGDINEVAIYQLTFTEL